MKRVLFSFLGLLLAFGCAGSKSPAEKTARGFMDAYYVNADLNEASRFAEGLALEKIKAGLQLREGFTIDSAAHQPKVRYKPVESRSGPEETDFFYDVEFRPEKSDPVRKKTRLKLRLRDGQWKVTQFSDQDA